MDAAAARAVQLHRDAAVLDEQAASLRGQRDVLVRQLWAAGWSYGRLARLLGVTRDGVRYMVHENRR